MKPIVTIEYCPKCGWLLRSAWMAQELLTTFSEEIEGVTLKPAELAGTFEITVGDKRIWERKQNGGFPDVKQLKQLVRDLVAPEKGLGHSEKK